MTKEEALKSFEEENKDFERTFERYGYQMSPEEVSAVKETIERNKVAISALSENKGEWIPVSERLPEVNKVGLSEWVLVTIKGIDKTVVMYDRLCANSWLSECFEGEKVLAWQPLPEPYKAEKTETCNGCTHPCIMYEPTMKACEKKGQ